MSSSVATGTVSCDSHRISLIGLSSFVVVIRISTITFVLVLKLSTQDGQKGIREIGTKRQENSALVRVYYSTIIPRDTDCQTIYSCQKVPRIGRQKGYIYPDQTQRGRSSIPNASSRAENTACASNVPQQPLPIFNPPESETSQSACKWCYVVLKPNVRASVSIKQIPTR